MRRRFRLDLLVFPLACSLLCLPACSDDDPSSPGGSTPLSQLGPHLLIEPASGPVGTYFHAKVVLDQGAASALDGYELWVPWPSSPVHRDFRLPAAEGGNIQVEALGTHRVVAEVFPPAGSTEPVLSLESQLEVTGGAADGSTDMVTIPAGPFLQGLPEGAGVFQGSGYQPRREVTLSTYALGRTEVTNDSWLAVVQPALDAGRLQVLYDGDARAGYVTTTGDPGLTLVDLFNSDLLWDGATLSSAPGSERRPIRGVSWEGAAAWCNLLSEAQGLLPAYVEEVVGVPPFERVELHCDFSRDGYRLPTEAEWEKAARGGLQLAGGAANPLPERWYPWGGSELYPIDWFAGGKSSHYANLWQTFSATTPVGSFPDGRSPYGLEDMVGNVSEWVNDWFQPDYYASAPAVDPRGPAAPPVAYEGQKIWRSAPFFEWTMYLETGCSSRFSRGQYELPVGTGFRLARNG